MYTGQTVRNDVCQALAALTHRGWRDGGVHTVAEEQAIWRQSWSGHQSTLKLYGPDHCPGMEPLGPMLN
jgi:hypothetical protein